MVWRWFGGGLNVSWRVIKRGCIVNLRHLFMQSQRSRLLVKRHANSTDQFL